MKALIVAGTGAGSPFSELFYGGLARAIGAHIHNLSGWGFDDCEQSIERLTAALRHESEQPLLVGHSQGGLIAAIVGLRYPELVGGVVSVCGPLRGVPLAPPWILWPASVASMACGSKLTRELAQSLWPDEVPLWTVAGSKDWLVPTNRALMGPNQHVLPCGHKDVVRRIELRVLVWGALTGKVPALAVA